MKEEKQYDALKRIKSNREKWLQLAFGALTCVFCCLWLCCPQYATSGWIVYHGPFEFRALFGGYVEANAWPWLQMICMLLFLGCAVCFFVFGARSKKEEKRAYERFLAHREEYENQTYLSANAKYYKAILTDYVKVNSYFYEKRGKVRFLYRTMTRFLFYPLIACGVLVPACILGYAVTSAHSEVPAATAVMFGFAAAIACAAFVFYFLVVQHRSGCFARYAANVTPAQLQKGDYVFDSVFMEHISADAKLHKRAEKMQAAGQKGILAYLFSDAVTAVLLGGMAIYLIVIVFIVALVVSIVAPDRGASSSAWSHQTPSSRALVLYGGMNERYETDGYGYVFKHGARTSFRINGREILDERGERVETVGWLREGSQTVDYANGYAGETPFLRWELE